MDFLSQSENQLFSYGQITWTFDDQIVHSSVPVSNCAKIRRNDLKALLRYFNDNRTDGHMNGQTDNLNTYCLRTQLSSTRRHKKHNLQSDIIKSDHDVILQSCRLKYTLILLLFRLHTLRQRQGKICYPDMFDFISFQTFLVDFHIR